MAEAQAGFEGVFSVLSKIPEERLVTLKHKLKHMRSATSSCKLLQAMVLLTLRREAEARICLDALGDDEGALCLCRCKWGTGSSKNPLSPQQEAGARLALARVYALLVEEKQCNPQCRDDAYKAAIEAFRASEALGRDRLGSILAEAYAKCGADFSSTETDHEFKTLRSDPGHFPTPNPAPHGRSPPVQIGNRSVLSGPQTLRSSGSPASFISHFEISQSPTMEFHTRSAHCNRVPQPSRLCGGAVSSTLQSGQERLSHGPRDASRLSCSAAAPLRSHRSEAPQTGGFVPPSLPVSETPIRLVSAEHCPVECTDPPTMGTAGLPESGQRLLQTPGQESPPEPPSLCPSGPAASASRVPIEDSYVLTEKEESESISSSRAPPPPQAAAAPAPELDCGEKRFFSFVVVHATEDVDIACRVKEMLESMGVPDGATFCEEFLVPGQCQLTCFQDAIDNSAFTLLLLTQNFASRLCMHQMNTALMDSLQRLPKYNSVIPFVPKEYPLKKSQIPSILMGLVPLDENSPVFSRTVKNTFKLKKINEQKMMWCQMQHVQEQRRKQQLYREHFQQLQQNLAALTLGSQPGYPPQMLLPTLLPSPAGIQHLLQQLLQLQTPSLPMFSSPSLHQPHPANPFTYPQPAPSPSQHLILPSGHQNVMQGSGGPQPLIIQNAQMVQIGDHNQMRRERTMSVPESSDEEIGESV
ncbi:TIR domain-containing adapter molecule 1 [Pelodiscus sinensis]|uniref:TIR domain-containing adapter molecule 1 n=1 Tax=Pelodiscus sinensis TaxID=13735 RepID=UPI003F6D612F